MSFDHVVETHSLSKMYGSHAVVRDLNLCIAPQSIVGFLGQNGAGKSTTIKMLLGIVHPTSGGGKILDRSINIPSENREIRRRTAYVAEDKALPRYMTVEQLIRFTRSFYSDWRLETENRLIKEFGLPLERKVGQLSKGMRTKLALLLALARRPRLLILDEPSEGLDPGSVERLLQELVEAAEEGTTVFFSSHQISEIERIADRICILDRGSLVLDTSMDELREEYKRVVCGFARTPPKLDFQFRGLISAQTKGRQVSMLVSHNIDSVVEYAHGLGPVSLNVNPVSLRELFLEMVKEE